MLRVFRLVKERGQSIVVACNTNVSVLGDAEQIVVMKGKNDRDEIFASGSIDRSAIRDSVCEIMEGAREVFLQRAKMYGLCLQ